MPFLSPSPTILSHFLTSSSVKEPDIAKKKKRERASLLYSVRFYEVISCDLSCSFEFGLIEVECEGGVFGDADEMGVRGLGWFVCEFSKGLAMNLTASI